MPVLMVKLKMRAIYKVFLSLIGFLIGMTVALGVMFLLREKVSKNDSDIEVAGNLSINYISGKNFHIDDEGVISFSVTNSGTEINYYNICFSKVRGVGTYELYYNNIVIMDGDLSTKDEISSDYISIDAGETKEYKIKIDSSDNGQIKGILNIRHHESSNKTFANLILENSAVSSSPLTEVGTTVATENEGLIKSNDDIGVSYYFRGNVDNNYVFFADMMWRIVRINGDGTVRIILDGVTDTIANYYLNDNFVREFESSNINDYLKSWLNQNLSDELDYLANAKYCSDITYNEKFDYTAYDRIMTNKIATLNCLGTRIVTNVGLLTIDEVVFAGASPSSYNKKYYLYKEDIKDPWYTMTGARGSDTYQNMFMIDNANNIIATVNGNLYRNVRPVINLIKNIEMTGSGTEKDPYVLKK